MKETQVVRLAYSVRVMVVNKLFSLSVFTAGIIILTVSYLSGNSPSLFAFQHKIVQERKVFTSNTHILDREYRSMQGPYHSHPLQLLPGESRQLVWLVGGMIEPVDAVTGEPIEPYFMCHSHIRFDPEENGSARHNAQFKNRTHTDVKPFTFVQGNAEIHFPSGFGLPIYSDEPLMWLTMAMSPPGVSLPRQVKQILSIDYIRNSRRIFPIQPLFRRVIQIVVPRSRGNIEDEQPHAAKPALGPLMHLMTSDRATAHWMVPPGSDERVTKVTARLNLPFDTTIHYIHAHLHPYGKFLRLRDLTTGDIVFESTFATNADELSIRKATHFSSSQGKWIYRDHEYQLESVYENPLAGPIDAMAVMYLYFHDREFTGLN